MDSEKNKDEKSESPAPNDEQQVPADALSRTPEDLEKEEAAKISTGESTAPEESEEKKLSPFKKFLHKVNIYFLIFVLLAVIAGATTVVSYLNSQKVTPPPDIADQAISQETLKQLANTDATVGNTSQTLTIQGNAVISGQMLTRGNLNVAGNIQTGGGFNGPSITISGNSNLGATQINSLQVATNTAIQGSTTLRDLNVAGTSSFGGPVTASQITVTKLILAGNGTLQLPNHLSFTGPSPGRSITGSGILGSGGSVSINGSDTSGSININTGNNPNGTGCIVKVNFNQAFASTPRIIISPFGSAAGAMDYYVDKTTTGFSLCTHTTPAANKVFGFDYFIAG